ncbi:hypothetical protein PR048_030751 [Dryococelus australis]|uniref:DUF4371 domain-containing protein n=1 Tax=Dryococelus australis TaxID=614101 RepID=A0ABQ9G9V5_9NEOP|nr:hypothetical protein PR048_030751 [Dryococelus australis]
MTAACLVQTRAPVTDNEGNFLELLRYRINSGDNELEKHVENNSARTTCTSKNIQNDDDDDDFIFYRLERNLTDRRDQQKRDETYIAKATVTGKNIVTQVLKILKQHDLDPIGCVGIDADGCSAMVPETKGAVNLIRKEAQDAILGRQLVGLCETRWVERHCSDLQFRTTLPKTAAALESECMLNEGASESKASYLLSAISESDFIVSVLSLSNLLVTTIHLVQIDQTGIKRERRVLWDSGADKKNKCGDHEAISVERHFSSLMEDNFRKELIKAVHDKLSTFEINLRKKSQPLNAYILTGALSDMRPVKLVTMDGNLAGDGLQTNLCVTRDSNPEPPTPQIGSAPIDCATGGRLFTRMKNVLIEGYFHLRKTIYFKTRSFNIADLFLFAAEEPALPYKRLNRGKKKRNIFFIRKIIDTQNPEYLLVKLINFDSLHRHSIRNANSIQVPRFSKSIYQKSFTYKASKIWNDLPGDLKTTTEVTTFVITEDEYLWGRGGVVVSQFASHLGEPGSNPYGIAPPPHRDFRTWELCRRMPMVGGYSRGSPVSLALATRLASPSLALKTPQDAAISLPRRLSVESEGDYRYAKLHLNGFISVWVPRQTDSVQSVASYYVVSDDVIVPNTVSP